MTEASTIPTDIQTAYNNLAAKMGDLAFRERDLTAALATVQDSIKTLQNERAALQKRLNEGTAPASEVTSDAVATEST